MGINEFNNQTINDDNCNNQSNSFIKRIKEDARNNIILNSFLISIIIYFFTFFQNYLSWSTQYFNEVEHMSYYLYYLPFCLVSINVIYKVRVKYTIIACMIIVFLLFVGQVYEKNTFVVCVINMLTPISNEFLNIAISSYLISFSTDKNIGTVFGIAFGIPNIIDSIVFLIQNKVNISNIQSNSIFIIGIVFLLVAISITLSLGCNSTANNCTDSRVEKVEGFFHQIVITSDPRLIYLFPAAICIGYSSYITIGGTLTYTGIMTYQISVAISGLISGFSSLIFGILIDKMNKRNILLIGYIIGIIGFIISCFINFNLFINSNSNSNSYNTCVYIVSILISISTNALSILIMVIGGGSFFKLNSLSFVSFIRFFQVFGFAFSFIFLTWIYYNISFYISFLLFSSGYIFLIKSNTKFNQQQQHHHHHNDYISIP